MLTGYWQHRIEFKRDWRIRAVRSGPITKRISVDSTKTWFEERHCRWCLRTRTSHSESYRNFERLEWMSASPRYGKCCTALAFAMENRKSGTNRLCWRNRTLLKKKIKRFAYLSRMKEIREENNPVFKLYETCLDIHTYPHNGWLHRETKVASYPQIEGSSVHFSPVTDSLVLFLPYWSLQLYVSLCKPPSAPI